MTGMSTAKKTADMEIPATFSGAFAEVEMVAGLPAVCKRSIPSKIQIYVGFRSWHIAGGLNLGCDWAGGKEGLICGHSIVE